jgi:hypothetical protein
LWSDKGGGCAESLWRLIVGHAVAALSAMVAHSSTVVPFSSSRRAKGWLTHAQPERVESHEAAKSAWIIEARCMGREGREITCAGLDGDGGEVCKKGQGFGQSAENAVHALDRPELTRNSGVLFFL